MSLQYSSLPIELGSDYYLYHTLQIAGRDNLAHSQNWTAGKTFVVIDTNTSEYRVIRMDFIQRLLVAIGYHSISSLYGAHIRLVEGEELKSALLPKITSSSSNYISKSIKSRLDTGHTADIKAIAYAFISFGKPEVADQIYQQYGLLDGSEDIIEEDSTLSIHQAYALLAQN